MTAFWYRRMADSVCNARQYSMTLQTEFLSTEMSDFSNKYFFSGHHFCVDSVLRCLYPAKAKNIFGVE